ncbi:MAG: cation diffusion facilitator family transporter, partial [Maioricimonas sp. JB045]
DDVHFDRVRTSAMRVEGVQDVEKLRIQQAGPDAHVDIDIEVDPEMSVADAHVITQHVRAQIQADWPFVRDVVVHVEPFYRDDH